MWETPGPGCPLAVLPLQVTQPGERSVGSHGGELMGLLHH